MSFWCRDPNVPPSEARLNLLMASSWWGEYLQYPYRELLMALDVFRHANRVGLWGALHASICWCFRHFQHSQQYKRAGEETEMVEKESRIDSHKVYDCRYSRLSRYQNCLYCPSLLLLCAFSRSPPNLAHPLRNDLLGFFNLRVFIKE